MVMPGLRNGTWASVTPGPRPNGRAASASSAAPKAGSEPRRGAPQAEEAEANGARCGPAERAASKGPEVALRDLLRGLRAGDLESVLLTVAMAAEENRMPCADPDEEARILAFLARLAEHDAMLLPPPPPRGAGVGAGGAAGRPRRGGRGVRPRVSAAVSG
jgi:hypothetical protein